MEENIFHLERYFHKEIARVQSVWYAQQSERGIKYPKSSKHIQRLYRKKQNAVKDYLHKVTRWIAEYCRKEDIRCVVVGDIRNIRKEKDMGHKANQKFHGLPYNKLYIMLEYKLKLYGIPIDKTGGKLYQPVQSVITGSIKKICRSIKPKRTGHVYN